MPSSDTADDEKLFQIQVQVPLSIGRGGGGGPRRRLGDLRLRRGLPRRRPAPHHYRPPGISQFLLPLGERPTDEDGKQLHFA